MNLTLRPHQAADLDQLRANIKAGIRRQILVAPTGYGKTCVAGAMIEAAVARGKYCHFWAHRQELIQQPSDLLTAIGVEHGIIRGSDSRRRPWAPVHVASVPTLIKRELSRAPDLIIIDECHRAQADSYRNLLARWPKAIVVGLTATPLRTDGRGLKMFQAMVIGPSTAELTEQGFLVPGRLFQRTGADLSNVQTKAGDYDQTQLEEAVDKPTLVGDIVSHYQRIASGRTAICFAVSIKHSHHLVDQFRAAGVHAEHIDGSTPEGERRDILARLHSGGTSVVCNVGVYVEGIDCPPASCCILARPTKSLTLYLQAIGRVLRIHPGKQDAIILDHAGCTKEHGWYDDAREWSPEGRKRLKRVEIETEAFLKVCPVCAESYHSRVAVCRCGYEFFTAERTVVQIDGQLEETLNPKRNYTIRKMSEDPAVAALQREAEAHNYKPGWVWKRRELLTEARSDFRQVFRCEPDRKFDRATLQRLIGIGRRQWSA